MPDETQPDAQQEALQVFNELAGRLPSVKLYMELARDSDEHQTTAWAQTQIRTVCAGDDLIWAAKLAQEHRYAVDAVDNGLLINIV